MKLSFHSLAVAAALVCGATSALAQATITQERALAGGVTPGDAPGFPITISQAGHYKLMGNLVVPPNMTGINITVDDVTIDLNGFRIAGPGHCERDPVQETSVCQGHHPLSHGIAASNTALNIAVRNGSLRGHRIGLYLRSGRVEDVHFAHNAFALEARGSGGFVGSRLVIDTNKYGGWINCSAVIKDSAMSRNMVGMEGCGSVQDSQVSDNERGLQGVKYRAVGFRSNKLDVSAGASPL